MGVPLSRIGTEQLPPRSARKRRDVLGAARAVFARVGYLRATIDLIAAEAGVSTRTVYNHFEGKDRLFAAVLLGSAAEVARLREEEIDRTLGDEAALADVAGLTAGLVALGRAWLRQSREQAEHFAIVRRINADAEEFPVEVLEAWQEQGPWRVQRVLAGRFAALRDAGVLVTGDPDVAALHFTALVTAGSAGPAGRGAPSLDDAAAARQVRSAVRAFLHGYGG